MDFYSSVSGILVVHISDYSGKLCLSAGLEREFTMFWTNHRAYSDHMYYLWHYAAVDAGGRYCKISFLLRFQTSASCKAHVLGECPFPCTDAALGNRRCCFTQKNRIFPIPLRASGWCCIDRYPDFFHRRTGKSLLPWI